MSTTFGVFENYIPYITDTIVEAGNPIILRSIQQAVRQMARDTEYFTEEYTLDVVSEQTDYTIESIYEARNIRVIEIELDEATVSNYGYSISDNGKTITLTNEPSTDSTDGLIITASILPNLDCCELDEDQMEAWAEAIISVTKSLLHAQPRKPWSDPMEASYQNELYEGYIELIAQNSVTQGQSGATTVNFGARL